MPPPLVYRHFLACECHLYLYSDARMRGACARPFGVTSKVDAVEFVLANGGNMSDKDERGSSALMEASFGGSVEAMKYILANGGNGVVPI